MPSTVMMPPTVSAIPAALATHIPRDHIFSPKIIPAKRSLHAMSIQPSATMNKKYGQQHPRQYRPWYVPMLNAPTAPFLLSSHEKAHRRLTVAKTLCLKGAVVILGF